MTAKEIYEGLVKRCKAHVKSVTSTVFDPSTGILKTFVAGKLVHTKQINTPKNP
jgi:hypothetical protein